ncbi:MULTISPECIES: ash family protein [unclassified Avibacterium]|uniref:ash family protein n=1 Tax=unclassified Avibacterium TaxID=2685287 RepID=UPI0020270341|nr:MULTISPECIES: ash family protein [unclassified Avibacterium]MCW9698771.1 ash family protein [Avibacterium sp. 20-129]URL07006.1 ash family protein [Avibacterium sp. 21-595]
MNNFHNTAKRLKIKAFTPFFYKCGAFFADFCLTENAFENYSIPAFAKSKAEPGNSNDILVAYSNTPINACFFMRSTNTPKESVMQICTTAFLSMVACYGKGFALCCVPQVAVFQPVTRYRPSLETLAVTSRKLFTCGVNAMIYLFKAVSRSDLRNTKKHLSSFPRYTVRINADSIEQATAQVAPFFVILGVKNA